MMTRADFLDAIRDEPGDLFRWGAFADWLEETGEPEQAEALRLSAAIVAETEDADRRDRLTARMGEVMTDPRARTAVDEVRAILFAEALVGAAAAARSAAGPLGAAIRGAAAALVAVANTVAGLLRVDQLPHPETERR